MTFGGIVCCEETNSSKNGSDGDSGISPSFKYITINTPFSRTLCFSASCASATLCPALFTPLSSAPSHNSENSKAKSSVSAYNNLGSAEVKCGGSYVLVHTTLFPLRLRILTYPFRTPCLL